MSSGVIAPSAALQRVSSAQPVAGERRAGVELGPVERRALGGALHLDEVAAPVMTTFMSVSARTSSS